MTLAKEQLLYVCVKDVSEANETRQPIIVCTVFG